MFSEFNSFECFKGAHDWVVCDYNVRAALEVEELAATIRHF